MQFNAALAAECVNHRPEGEVERSIMLHQFIDPIGKSETNGTKRRLLLHDAQRQMTFSVSHPLGRLRQLQSGGAE